MEVITLDLKFRDVPRALASFLVLAPSGPVLIETGPGSTTSRLEISLSEARELFIIPKQVLLILLNQQIIFWYFHKRFSIHNTFFSLSIPLQEI